METWRILYVWATYVMPHLRYGALAYIQQNHKKVKDQKFQVMDKYRKVYNGSIKQLFKLHRSTAHAIINVMMDCWSAEAVAVQSYIRNANLWMESYRHEIYGGEVNELYSSIRHRYTTIQEKAGVSPWHVLDRTSIEKFYKYKCHKDNK